MFKNLFSVESIVIGFAVVLCFCLLPIIHVAQAADRLISGTITGVDCGDATTFFLKQASGKKLEGVCYEKWCDDICSSSSARKNVAGRKISAKIRITNIEEPEHGAIVNEFYSIVLQ